MIRCSDAITASYRACKIKSQRPAVPNCLWVSSVYHQDIALVTDSLDGQYWHSNTVGEVLFSQALEYALQKAKFDLAVEIGAHPALKGPALQVMGDTIGRSMPYTGTLNRGLEDDQAFASTLGYIWANLPKSSIDLGAFDRFMTATDPPMLLKGLPTYPWNHERAYWHESRVSRAYRSRSARHDLLGLRSTDYSDDQISWKNHLVPEKMTWLQDHRIQGQMVFPGAAYIVTAFEAARQITGEQSVALIELTDFVFDQPLVFVGEDSRMEVLTSLHGIRRDKSKITADFTFHSIAREASGPMTLNAHCQLNIYYGIVSDAAISQPSVETHFGMREVDSDRIYKYLAGYGYQYTGAFQSLTSVSRRLGVASGLIALPPRSGTTVTMHPATLDAAMHSIMVAESYPGDGRLTTSRVPTGISKISLNLSAAMDISSQTHVRFLSRNVDDGQRVDGEVKLSLVDSAETILQLEGLRTKPMRSATPADDICMFSETVWGPRCLLPSSDHESSGSSSRVVDDRVQFLRNPLSADSSHTHNLDEQVVLIGGKTSPTSTCADKVADILQPYTRQLIRAHSIPSLTEIKTTIGNSVVILQDHDKPLFDNFNDSVLTGLRKLFATSRNVLWVTHGYKRNEPHARMFVAFARCLVQEMSHIRLQILDFEAPGALDAQLIAVDFLRLLATARWEEQGSLGGLSWCVEPEIAYEKGCAFVPRVKPCKAFNDRYNSASRTIFRDIVTDEGVKTQVRVQPIDQEQLFQCDKTYWLAGLTGDLGLSLCEWMIKKGARHIALSSRHPTVDPAWLAHFCSSGATVEIFTCDVTDYSCVEATLRRIEASMPPIAGVCHGAMVLQDALFQDVNMAQVEQVLKPKVGGAINLDKAFHNRSLDFFVLLSSITAITGNAGQSIYAAANGYLAGLAARRRARGEPASTINLGPILGAGAMHALTTAQQAKLEKEGVMWTSEHDFHTAFAEAVVASPSDSGSSGEFTTGVRICDVSEQYKPKYASNPIFSHMLSHRGAMAQPSAIRSPAEPVRAQLLRARNEDTVFQILEGTPFHRRYLSVVLTKYRVPDVQAAQSTPHAPRLDYH
jgi:acyl transferase domain-containing protein